MTQSTDRIIMVRPHRFYSNPETSASNSFQADSVEDVTLPVHKEFNNMVALLQEAGVTVQVYDGPEGSPDAVFPNNTFSTHLSKKGRGILVSYPMEAENRQQELSQELIDHMKVSCSVVQDLRVYHDKGEYLEGTGSLVLDRVNKVAYALRSSRTHMGLTDLWAENMNYDVVAFDAHDEQGDAIYHTNVFMSVGSSFAVAALETMPDKDEKNIFLRSLEYTGHEVIEISREQMNNFCGNILEVKNALGERVVVMSETAAQSFTAQQMDILNQHCDHILAVPIPTIEKFGGGGVRCMIAENFAPEITV